MNQKKYRISFVSGFFSLSVCCILLVIPGALFSQIMSISSGDWNNNTIWDCLCIPTAGMNVTVDSTHTVIVGGGTKANNLVIMNSGQLINSSGTLKLTNSFNNYGSCTINGIIKARNWYNHDTTIGSGILCVSDTTSNYGVVQGTIEICDSTPPTGFPFIDNNSGMLDSTIKFCTVTANFSFTIDTTKVTFANLSQGASDFLWQFGDGDSSTVQDPSHIYQGYGIYVVTLKASNVCGKSITKTDTINMSPVQSSQETIKTIKSKNLNVQIHYNSYPGSITIDYEFNTEINSGKIVIINSLGALITNQQIYNKQGQLKVKERVDKGMYFIVFFNDEKKIVFSEKIIAW